MAFQVPTVCATLGRFLDLPKEKRVNVLTDKKNMSYILVRAQLHMPTMTLFATVLGRFAAAPPLHRMSCLEQTGSEHMW